MTTNFNQFKDTTVYGDFSNSTGKSRTANATFDGLVTSKSNMNVNGDLYVGISSSSGETITDTGGKIFINKNNVYTDVNNLFQKKETGSDYYITESVVQTRITNRLAGYITGTNLTSALGSYQLKGNYLTTASFDGYADISTLSSRISSLGFLLSSSALAAFQVKGDYATTTTLANYLTTTSATDNYLPKASGDLYLLKTSNWVSSDGLTTQLAGYLSSISAATTYQVKGNYLTSASFDAYATKLSPVFTGAPKSVTQLTADNSTNIATTAYVKSNLVWYASKVGPIFTGTPKAPTPLASDTTTRIATCQWVKNLNYAPSPVITRLQATVLPFITSNTVHSFKFADKYVILPAGKYIITYNIRFVGTPISQIGYAPITVTKLIFGLCKTATELNNFDDDLGLGANMKLNFSQLLTDGPTQLSGTFIGDYNSFNADGSVFFNVTPTWTGTGFFKIANATLTYVKIADTTSVFIPFIDEEDPIDPPIFIDPIPLTEQSIFTATIKLFGKYWRKLDANNNFVNTNVRNFYFTDNNGFYLSPYVNIPEIYDFFDPTVQSVQGEIPYVDGVGLQIRFPNPYDKKFKVDVTGVWQNSSNQTYNQGLTFQINNKTNGLLIDDVRHSYFYLRWSYNNTLQYADLASIETISGLITHTGLNGNQGLIDLYITLF